MRYHGNNTCPDKRTNKQTGGTNGWTNAEDRQPEDKMPYRHFWVVQE